MACDCKEDCSILADAYCFSFDIRQCQTDIFASLIPESDSKKNREQKMSEWLESLNFEVDDVLLELNFHEAVCEACNVCPQGDRYFIQLNKTNNLDNLNLLNLTTEDCCEIFFN